jgi:GH24 family phage-related lysozyme (muramidase)
MTNDIEASWEEVQADFERWEGKLSHMYLDTVGLVTVGVGKMLPDVGAAQELRFVRRADGTDASPEEIAADYNAVSSQAKGRLAATYRRYTSLDLPDEAIGSLLKAVVEGFEADLEGSFAGYDSYPLTAKRALLDMIYNLGLVGLLKFKKLQAAVESGDWQAAAAQCHRNGPSQERNDWTRDQFLAAAA